MKKTTFYWFVAVFGVVPVVFCASLWFLESGVSCSVPPEMRVEQELMSIAMAVKMYQINAGRPPTTAQGLDALVNEPTTGPTPRRWTQVMRKLPQDPWQTPYRFTLLTPKEYEWRWELRSAGGDGVFGSGDDLMEVIESGSIVPLRAAHTEEKVEPRPSF